MSTKRMRRFVLTAGSAVVGARDFNFRDLSEWDNTKSDNEGAGYEVRMSTGPYEVDFKLQAEDANVVTGYKTSISCAVKEVAIDEESGTETLVDRTYAFGGGWLKKDLSSPTDNPGEISVTGRFRTHTPPEIS